MMVIFQTWQLVIIRVVVTSDNTGCQFTDSYTVIESRPFNINVLSIGDQTQCGVDDGSVFNRKF